MTAVYSFVSNFAGDGPAAKNWLLQFGPANAEKHLRLRIDHIDILAVPLAYPNVHDLLLTCVV